MQFRKTSLVVVFLFLAAWAGAQDGSEDPYEIVEKYYKAVGGLELHKAIKSIYSEATITIEGAGISGTYKTWQLNPDLHRSETDLKVIKSTEGDNGEYAWEVDTNGKLKIIKDEHSQKRRRIRRLVNEFEHLNRDSELFTLTYNGADTANGVKCHVVKMTNSINDDVSLSYYNMETYLLEKDAVSSLIMNSILFIRTIAKRAG